MKIIFLSDNFPPYSLGGAGIVACNLAKKLAGMGHDIHIISSVQKKDLEGIDSFANLKIYRIYSNYNLRWQAWLSLYNYQTVPAVRKIIKDIKPDIVHAHNIHSYLSYYSLKIARQYSKAVFLTAHDAMAVNYGKAYLKYPDIIRQIGVWDQIRAAKKRYNPFRNILIRHYLKYADKIFAVSDSLKEFLGANGIKNIATLYNGIDVEEWRISEKEAEEFKKKHGLQEKKVILFGGRISEAKGGEVILRAMALVVKSVQNAVLLIVGKGDFYNQALIKLAKELTIERNVKFTGWIQRDEMRRAFFSSDICVTPSIYLDPFNLLNIEAGAAGKPVVGTCFGGTPEIVIDNQTGYIVNPLDIKALAEKIIDLLNDPTKAQRFGEAGRKRVKEYFSLDRQAEETARYYLKAIRPL